MSIEETETTKFLDDCGGIQPLEIIEKEEYKRKVELVLQKQRNRRRTDRR